MLYVNDIIRLGIAFLKERMGVEEEQFCIRGSYKHRADYYYFNDTTLKDEWQKEVYIRAAALAKEFGIRSGYDIGCGSGYKLMKHFSEYETIGFDVPETLAFLENTYPGRTWKYASFSDRGIPPADLIICADVIEHVPNPSELLEFIQSVASKWVVLSTPDRDLVYSRLSPHRLGPPRNPCHIREWSFTEFERFVSKYMSVREHVISNRQQATQMIVATL